MKNARLLAGMEPVTLSSFDIKLEQHLCLPFFLLFQRQYTKGKTLGYEVASPTFHIKLIKLPEF